MGEGSTRKEESFEGIDIDIYGVDAIDFSKLNLDDLGVEERQGLERTKNFYKKRWDALKELEEKIRKAFGLLDYPKMSREENNQKTNEYNELLQELQQKRKEVNQETLVEIEDLKKGKLKDVVSDFKKRLEEI